MRVLRTVTRANSAATKNPLANTRARTAVRRHAISPGPNSGWSITCLRGNCTTAGTGIGDRVMGEAKGRDQRTRRRQAARGKRISLRLSPVPCPLIRVLEVLRVDEFFDADWSAASMRSNCIPMPTRRSLQATRASASTSASHWAGGADPGARGRIERAHVRIASPPRPRFNVTAAAMVSPKR